MQSLKSQQYDTSILFQEWNYNSRLITNQEL
jgi:hypothetical protein